MYESISLFVLILVSIASSASPSSETSPSSVAWLCWLWVRAVPCHMTMLLTNKAGSVNTSSQIWLLRGERELRLVKMRHRERHSHLGHCPKFWNCWTGGGINIEFPLKLSLIILSASFLFFEDMPFLPPNLSFNLCRAMPCPPCPRFSRR